MTRPVIRCVPLSEHQTSSGPYLYGNVTKLTPVARGVAKLYLERADSHLDKKETHYSPSYLAVIGSCISIQQDTLSR